MQDLPNIRSGQKLRMAIEAKPGSEPSFDLICSFFKSLDSSAFLISIPMQGSQPLPLDDSRKLLLLIESGNTPVIVTGYADDLVREGIRRYWKIRKVDQRQFFRRSEQRLKATLRLSYMQDTWRVGANGQIEPMDALSIDISNGGLAMYLRDNFEVGEVCRVTLPKIGVEADGESIKDIVGVVCWTREAPKGSPYKHICGLQFRFESSDEKDALARYVATVQKSFAL